MTRIFILAMVAFVVSTILGYFDAFSVASYIAGLLIGIAIMVSS